MKDEFIDYKELLSRLEKGKSHLLLGNGFNNALTVKTNYADIFIRMIELFPDYEMLSEVINICENDLEKVIGKLQDNIEETKVNKLFLDKFIEKKFKADFIKATNAIVRENLKNIYQEKNEGIYLLFEKFDNYFTLNNDPLLYLLLLKFKKSKSKEIPLLVFQSNDRLFDVSMSDLEKETFDIIKTAYENGQIRIHSEDLSVTKFLKDLHKSTLKNHTKDLVKANLGKISNSSFKKVYNKFLSDIDNNPKVLNSNDGFQDSIFKLVESNSNPQNVFYLHGAFHIYQNGKFTHKITKTEETSMMEEIEEIIENDAKELICIFKANGKVNDIQKNPYLSKAINKLSEIEGDVLIYGTALSDNDSHIFSRLNDNPKINRLYISTTKQNLKRDKLKSKDIFPKKETIFFDYKTVSFNTEVSE